MLDFLRENNNSRHYVILAAMSNKKAMFAEYYEKASKLTDIDLSGYKYLVVFRRRRKP